MISLNPLRVGVLGVLTTALVGSLVWAQQGMQDWSIITPLHFGDLIAGWDSTGTTHPASDNLSIFMNVGVSG